MYETYQQKVIDKLVNEMIKEFLKEAKLNQANCQIVAFLEANYDFLTDIIKIRTTLREKYKQLKN